MKHHSLALTALLLSAVSHAAPPRTPPDRLPTSPAEVADFLKITEEGDDRHQQNTERMGAARTEYGNAWVALRNGAFKAAGGMDDPDYRRLADAYDEWDAKWRAKMEEEKQEDDPNEREALRIEVQRLRARRDALDSEGKAFVIQRCLALPNARAEAEQVQLLAVRADEALAERMNYWNRVHYPRRTIAQMYRQKAPGADFTRTRTIQLAPPVDANRRLEAFARRNDPASLEELAHRLFRALDENAPGLEEAFTRYREKRFAESLDAFRDCFLHKLTHPEDYGIWPEAFVTGPYAPLAPAVFPIDWADDATRGIATQANRYVSRDELLKIEVGPPGAINWAHVADQPRNSRNEPESIYYMRALHVLERESDPNGLLCWLIEGYQTTGQRRYLQRWAEYADDWAMNMQRDLNAVTAQELEPGAYHPNLAMTWNLRYYHTLIPRVLTGFVTRLRAIVLAHPEAAREISAPTLARVLLVAIEEYVSPNILVARATRFNWNMMGLGFNVRNSLLLGEFKTGQWLGRETARTLQNHALFSIMPDGGYVEYSDEGHQGVWRERGGDALDLLQKHRPDWFDAAMEADLRESLDQSGRFWLRHMKPDGHRHRDDYRFHRESFVGKRFTVFGRASLDAQLPELVGRDEPARMLDTVFGDGTRGKPRHLSDVMPYLGEVMLRGGWGTDDPFFYMHSGRVPNSNPDEDSSAFKLHDHGNHLLTAQPIYVDGRTQNSHFHHIDNVGAKTSFLTHSDGQPIKGRWHTSDHFDLAEGVYEGAYEDRNDRTYWSTFHTGGYDMRRWQRSLGQVAVTDVHSHTRQVFFVRDPVCWIVVDRIRCDAEHDYEFPYELYTPVDKVNWLRRAKTPIPKANRRVVIDEKSAVVRTDNPGFPRVAMHHFGSGELSVEFDPKSHDLANKDSLEIRDAEREWRLSRPELRDWMAFVRRTLAKWSGEGDQLLVTLITTAPADSEAAWGVEGEGTEFTALAPDGSTVHFAAGTGRASLRAGDTTARADALLAVDPKDAKARGIVLGAGSLAIGGKPIRLATESAEFALGSSPSVTREIHAPIQPVTFGPDVNVFHDSMYVTMATKTPGVEIRYTLDGSEPTLDSPLYAKPVGLTESTTVRAIAVRPGVKELHWPLDPGFATLPTRAEFEKQPLSPAEDVANLTGGLRWEYAEGQAFALVATSDFVLAQESGVTKNLFDLSMHQGGRSFTVRYDGYLDVPADGVYTFHAPREFVIPDVDPGYDLRVLVDGEEWWPVLRRHALGTWSRALAKGPHRFRVIFTDARTKPLKHETWRNWPNPDVLWKGKTPAIEISGPGLSKQPVPSAWFHRIPNN